MDNELGSKLKHLRKGRGLTQLQLSERVSISRCTVSNYENGRRHPNLSELRKLADYFGVGLDFFGVETKDESFELLSRAKSILSNKEIPREEREQLYKSLMRIYLEIDEE